MAPKDIHALIPGTCECYPKRDFADAIKFQALKVGSLCWILLVGPKSNCKCPYKREAEGHLATEGEKVVW